MVKRAMTAMALIVGGAIAPASAAGAAAAPDAAFDPLLPCTIRISPVFRPVVLQLLSFSPTFRAQVQRIAAAPHVRVSIEPAVGGVGGCCSLARTVFQHYSEGGIRAQVEIAFPLTATEYAELLGHEFEHIVEQIDRVDVRRLAREGGGAQQIGDDAYETRRAARAGRRIAEEAETAGIEPPDLVRHGLARTLSAISRVFWRTLGARGGRTRGRPGVSQQN